MDKKRMLTKIKMGFRKDGNLLLTGLGVLGFGATIYSCIKETKNVTRKIDYLEKEIDRELNVKEKVKFSIPHYKKTIGFGLTTLSCFVGSTVLSRKNQSALIGAYTMLDQSYKRYKEEVAKTYGQEAADEMMLNVENIPYKSYQPNIMDNDGDETMLFYEPFTGAYIETTLARVKNAELMVNKKLAEDSYVDLDTYYKYLGLNHISFKKADEYGWSLYYNEINWIPFRYQLSVNDDGLECWIIIMEEEPTHCLAVTKF